MKRSLIAEILLIVVTFGFTSCNAPSPVMQVTQSSEISLQHWQTFSAPDASFTIEFPAKPVEERYSIDSPAGKLEIHSYKYTGTASYSISYTDYPLVIDGAGTADAALDHARDGGLTQVNGRLIKESRISMGDHPGRLFVVESPKGGRTLIMNKVYLVGRRLYSMQVVIPQDSNESQPLAAASEKFLDSFKLTKAAGN